MKSLNLLLLAALILPSRISVADSKQEIKVGVATVLTGDAAVIGTNIQKTIDTYKKRYLRHPIRFIFEDAKISSADGLTAYRRLVDTENVDMIIGGTTSNGTVTGAPLVNKSKTVLITPLTGGSNIDSAGEYIFRIGSSDILNGYQQADLFTASGFKRVALLTEQTEYTMNIAKFFRERFVKNGGVITTDEEFLPGTTDFRSLILRIKSGSPQALFGSTQTGLAFGLFLKQLKDLSKDQTIEIHTNFVSADNPDARKAAGDAIYGVHYMAPTYDKDNPKLVRFLKEFREDHGQDPAIIFHAAGTVDALDMLQSYLDEHPVFSREGFHDFLLKRIKNYSGVKATYSFDPEGNADIGFEPRVIEK
jgi:branched-chain amino acid transport system substrate-binding protein